VLALVESRLAFCPLRGVTVHAAYHIKVVCILQLIDRQPQTFAAAALNSHTTNKSH